jgi:hypothetical protein
MGLQSRKKPVKEMPLRTQESGPKFGVNAYIRLSTSREWDVCDLVLHIRAMNRRLIHRARALG